ncbi:MAG: barstar family protein [Mycobacterium sp.]|uniref:barstar family protein n=1 Tax=Mycobacterium sp. TaxID=1785 RepID=UPI003BB05C12
MAGCGRHASRPGADVRIPGHYGRNWSALNDCLRDVRDHEYGFPAEASGLAMVLTGFDAFAAKFPDDAHTLLDIYAENQRSALIDGDNLICLVQSDDPALVLAPVGATNPQWNPDEWLNRDRGL